MATCCTARVAVSPSGGTVRVRLRPPCEAPGLVFGDVGRGPAAGRCGVFALGAGREVLLLRVAGLLLRVAGLLLRADGRFSTVFGVVTVHIRSWVRDFAPQRGTSYPRGREPASQESIRLSSPGGGAGGGSG
ncbi:hypothetical protein ADL25_29260 [Streptomyces sp. NRRL F-5122]|nr:hypothetical protein ADL25_29260 [Streptomyces sp. NRRL F-5122]